LDHLILMRLYYLQENDLKEGLNLYFKREQLYFQKTIYFLATKTRRKVEPNKTNSLFLNLALTSFSHKLLAPYNSSKASVVLSHIHMP